MKGDEKYKPIEAGAGKEAIDELRNELLSPLEADIQKLRDPITIAAIMHTAATEQENTNRLLKTLIERLDSRFAEVDARIEALETTPRRGFFARSGPARSVVDKNCIFPSPRAFAR